MGKIYLYGNWKMNKGIKETSEFLDKLKNTVDSVDPLKKMLAENRMEIAIFPPFLALPTAIKDLPCNIYTNMYIGSQNFFYEEKGAFTGEISWSMLKEIECRYSLIGHSERRHIFGEDDLMIGKKVQTALRNGIIPVLCYGETLEEREKGETRWIVERQLGSVLKSLGKELSAKKMIFAYEPVWAIGTGRSAQPDDAEEVCKYTREYLRSILGTEQSETTPILYGGSVNASNSEILLKQQDIDGVLVGGASLDPVSFIDIIKPFV